MNNFRIMADTVLTLRELNRATLARQLLLERASLSVPAAVEQLVGLQAQLPRSPYIGLWTRLRDFERENLAQRIEDQTIVKATLMRATLHLFTAADYVRLRATLQPALDRAFESIAKRRGQGLDFDRILTVAAQFIAEQPRTFAEISAKLSELVPEGDVGAMRYAVRTHLPLVQVPISSGWSYPTTPQFALAEHWLGQQIPTEDHLRILVFRYLTAFGPATVADLQTWSGLVGLKDAIENLKPELRTYRDEQGRELLDLPDMPLPAADTPAPERFLPEFDNLLLAHTKRTRIVSDDHRAKVFLPGLRVAATVLVDGFVRGVWKIEKAKGVATLVIEPLETLTKQNRVALAEEAERLVRFVENSAKAVAVQFMD